MASIRDFEPFGEAHEDWITSLVMDQLCTLVCSASMDKTVKLWDLRTGAMLQDLPHHDWVRQARVNADAGQVISCCWDGVVVWDVQVNTDGGAKDEKKVFAGRAINETQAAHKGPCYCCHHAGNDGLRLLTGGQDRALSLWDIETGQRLSTTDTFHAWGITVISFSPVNDGLRLTADEAGHVVLVELTNTNLPVAAFDAHTHEITGVAWRPGGGGLATASGDATVKVWDWPSRETTGGLFKLNKEPHRVLRHPEAVTGVLWGSGGVRRTGLIVSACHDAKVRLWDVHKSEVVAYLEGHTQAVTCLVWTPDETRLITGSKDGSMKSWDTSPFILES